MSEVESIIKRARVAQEEYQLYTQEQVDLVVSAVAWAILEQAVDDLATYCRFGIITTKGKCLPWPYHIKLITKVSRYGKLGTYPHKIPRVIAGGDEPHEHRALVAWFKSSAAQDFCDLIGCRLPAAEIFSNTIKHHGGLK